MGQSGMIAFVTAIAASAIAAAQPAPVKAAAPATTQITAAATTPVDIPAEPSRIAVARTPATLRDAAEANDYAAFDRLIRKARVNGETLGAFADLYDVWSFAQSNPTGAYYGAGIHDRLVARYPGYAKFIEDYRITDRRGASFYPNTETRAFLLEQAIEGNDPQIAAVREATPRAASTKAVSSIAASHQTAPASKPVSVAAVPAPIGPAESLASDVLASDMRKVTPQVQRKAAEPEMVDTSATTRGIFLIIFGLIGIGVLTMTMQASGSDVHVADDEVQGEHPVTITASHDGHPRESQG